MSKAVLPVERTTIITHGSSRLGGAELHDQYVAMPHIPAAAARYRLQPSAKGPPAVGSGQKSEACSYSQSGRSTTGQRTGRRVHEPA